ncbi:MAG: alginate export family protein [Sandaracinobacter sp.]
MRAGSSFASAFALGLACVCCGGTPARGQSASPSDPFTGVLIERVEIVLANPSPDAALNSRVADGVRRRLGLFPGARYAPDRTDLALAQAKRTPDVAGLVPSIGFGDRNGLVLTVTVTLADAATSGGARGQIGAGQGFPVLYDRDGTHVRAKVEAMAMAYANANAWFARPDAMLAGNPLIQGRPAGRGATAWLEGYVHTGLSGITPVTDTLYVYGAASIMATGSSGRELFSDQTRFHAAVEDAYAGFIVGRTTAAGTRYGLNISAGRQRFLLADGFLIAGNAANGHDRGALQANARWAADMVVQAQFFYNDARLEAFYVDPDELPIIDSRTQILGLNLELKPAPGLIVAASWLTVPRSTFGYFAPTGGVGTREGLRLWDMRLSWAPAAPGAAGPFFGGEIAEQRNSNFPMRARAGYAEIGYSFPRAPWSPSFSYRLGAFSGDDPSTARFERWDPLLSGGNGEQWVQGANMFKVVQNSNAITHRFQARLRPDRMVELVPQVWLFRADSLANIGGNPALQFLSGKDYGAEVNMTAKWFVSRNTYVHGHIAYTMPGSAIQDALQQDADNWLSAMMFVRYAF